MSDSEKAELEQTDKRVKKREHEKDSSDDDSESTSTKMKLPKKRFYRQRAHVNPLNFNVGENHYRPNNPESMKWEDFFGPSFNEKHELVKNVDVGCGYGGLLMKLSQTFPDQFSVGMEIREKVSRYVKDKITALRHNEPGNWENICCIRTNAMQYLPNFFAKAQLERMFFLYPDPHFKKSKIKWRIISIPLISQYAYLMKTGGNCSLVRFNIFQLRFALYGHRCLRLSSMGVGKLCSF
jgi:tRNA (guanine-N7-)-methyltransferase